MAAPVTLTVQGKPRTKAVSAPVIRMESFKASPMTETLSATVSWPKSVLMMVTAVPVRSAMLKVS